jgi:CRP-like cAMP-binding protein
LKARRELTSYCLTVAARPAFHLPGDIFGLENGNLHRFTAEAIVDTTARLVKRESIEREAKDDAVILRNLLKMTTDNLQHAENHLLPFRPPNCNREGGSISA